MTADQDRYVSIEAEEYVERIVHKARLHNIGLRIESQAALNASLVCLHQALNETGDVGALRTIANECVSDILENASSPRTGVTS